jgi:hypothetical protein
MDSNTRRVVAASLISAAEKLEEIRPSSLKDVVDAIHSGDPTAITASSLGRVWQHVQDLTQQSFVIISAFRSIDANGNNLSWEDNMRRTHHMQEGLRGLGLGYIRLIGHWLECQKLGVKYKDCPPDQLVDVREFSLFVPNMSIEDGQRLAKRFDQDGFVYGGPETDGLIKVLASSDRPVISTLGDRLTTQAIGQAFSSLHDDESKRFAFIGVGTDTPMDSLIASSYEKEKYGVKKFHSIWGQV